MFPPIQASGRALRSVKHERRKDQHSGIALRDANTTMRAFERFAGGTIRLGECLI